MTLDWLAFAVGMTVLASASWVLDRVILKDKRSNDPFAYGFVIRLVGVVLFGAYLLYSGTFRAPAAWQTWALMVLGSFFWSYATIQDFKASSAGDLTLAMPLRRIRLLFVIILSALLFGEAITPLKIAAFILVIAGALVASTDKQIHWRAALGHPVVNFLILAAISSGLGVLLDKYLVGVVGDPLSYAFIGWALGLVTFPFLFTSRRERITALVQSNPGLIVLASLVTAGTSFLWCNAFLVGQAGQILLVYELNLPLTFLAGVLFLGERDNLKRRALGSAIVLAGAVLAALA